MNQKVYVDSANGLRVRSGYGLSAKKIGLVYDRMKLKIVEVGPKEKIDGITSNWIRVILPVESIKEKRSVCGWIFGGYVTSHLKPFSTDKWTDDDLILYLSRFEWCRYQFTPDGKCDFGMKESGCGGLGTYSVSAAAKTVDVVLHMGDEENEWDVKHHWKISSVDEDRIVFLEDNETVELLPCYYTYDIYYWSLNHEKLLGLEYGDSWLYILCYESGQKFLKDFARKNKVNDVFYSNVKLMGIDLD